MDSSSVYNYLFNLGKHLVLLIILWNISLKTVSSARSLSNQPDGKGRKDFE
jgi:hypothetical protein